MLSKMFSDMFLHIALEFSIWLFYLPRTIRFKPENVLIAGMIPGSKEPSVGEMNSYSRPLVKELNWLWSDGFKMRHKNKTVSVRAALLATVSDVPATAKLGGFLGHSSKHACWKCSKEFPHNESLKCVDFSGVKVETLQTHEQHKKCIACTFCKHSHSTCRD